MWTTYKRIQRHCYAMRGVPYMLRPMYGLRRPKARIPGTDIAGTVEQAGPGGRIGPAKTAVHRAGHGDQDVTGENPADLEQRQDAPNLAVLDCHEVARRVAQHVLNHPLPRGEVERRTVRRGPDKVVPFLL